MLGQGEGQMIFDGNAFLAILTTLLVVFLFIIFLIESSSKFSLFVLERHLGRQEFDLEMLFRDKNYQKYQEKYQRNKEFRKKVVETIKNERY